MRSEEPRTIGKTERQTESGGERVEQRIEIREWQSRKVVHDALPAARRCGLARAWQSREMRDGEIQVDEEQDEDEEEDSAMTDRDRMGMEWDDGRSLSQ